MTSRSLRVLLTTNMMAARGLGPKLTKDASCEDIDTARDGSRQAEEACQKLALGVKSPDNLSADGEADLKHDFFS